MYEYFKGSASDAPYIGGLLKSYFLNINKRRGIFLACCWTRISSNKNGENDKSGLLFGVR